MSINFNAALGIHEQALLLREQRNQVLAANIANADTPGYQARDFDFRAALEQASTSTSANATNTATLSLAAPQGAAHASSIGTRISTEVPTLKYRAPFQSSMDGNTVETHIEQSKFSENAMHYQATLTFLGNQFSGIKAALNGN